MGHQKSIIEHTKVVSARMPLVQRVVTFICVSSLAVSLGACAGSNIPDAKATTGRNPTVAEQPNANETVRGENDPPIVTLDLGASLRARHLSEQEDLPAGIIIPTTNFNAVPVTAALQAVLAGTDVSLSWDTGSLDDHLVTVMNLSGPMPQVVEKICNAARVFCSYRAGSLKLQEKDVFIVGLPPVAKVAGGAGTAASTNTMSDTIAKMVGSKVQIDSEGGNIIYTADVESQSAVERYLEELRNGRPLVVLQMYIWEVTLNKENTEGINWNELNISGIGPGFAKLALSSASAFAGPADVGVLTGAAATDALTSGGVSLGAVTTGNINTNSLISFLSTQGRLQTISNPQMTFVSGSSASFKVGGKQRYISEVGQLVSSTNTSGTATSPTTGVGTNTVNTDSIDTGLSVSVNGSYENGVVFANLDLDLTNLVSLNPTTTGGETIDLPSTTDEKMDTSIRVRPGDNLVMAGLVTSADTNTRQGVPLPDDGRIPTYGDDTLQNHELVVVIKPSVVLFSDKLEDLRKRSREAAAAKPLPDAIVIDKNGPQTMVLPSTNIAPPPLPPQAQIATPEPRPELMASNPATAPTAPIPVAPSADGAPVDNRLMQRGFSHAFDELLQSDQGSVASANAGMRQ